MRAMRFMCASMVAGASAWRPSRAFAQENPQALRQEIDQLRQDFEALKQQYGDRLTALEAKLARPKARACRADAAVARRRRRQPPTAPVPAGAEGAGGRPARCRSTARPSPASKIFNPDIAVIGDFLGAAGTNHVNPTAGVRDARVGGLVPGGGRSVCARRFLPRVRRGRRRTSRKASSRFTSLPGGLLTKVGKMRAAFGKVNTLHNHILPWADRPLVTQQPGWRRRRDRRRRASRWRGWSRTRGSSSKPPARCFAAIRATCSTSQQARRPELRRPPARLSRHHRGQQHRPRLLVLARAQRRRRRRRRSLRHASRRSSTASTRRSGGGRCSGRSTTRSSAAPSGSGAGATSRMACSAASGFYVSGDYQLGRRWFAGARYDRSDRATDASLLDTGGRCS